jgi:hypothetical protein
MKDSKLLRRYSALTTLIFVQLAGLFCIHSSPGATHPSNGNGLGYTDVGAWYETLYDDTMWSLGSYPANPIKHLPLCPSPIVYSNTWTYNTSASGCWNGDCHTSQTTNASVTYVFTGTGIRIIGDTGPTNGTANVYLDGTQLATIDTYSSSLTHQVSIYVNTNLTSATHTCIVQVATGQIAIDAFHYTYSWIDLNINQYNNSPTVFDTGWTFYTGASGFWGNHTGYWQDNYHYSKTTDATADFRFAGTGLRIIGDTGTTNGIAKVYLDTNPSPVATIDTYSALPSHQQLLYEVTGLANTTHDVYLKVQNTKNISSSDTFVAIDEYKYLPNTVVWSTNNDNDTTGYHQYLSSDTNIIDFHLRQIADAKIDFVLFDITNGGLGQDGNHMGGYNYNNLFFITNLQTACKRIKAWNDSNSWKIKYAIAAGTHAALEAVADDVYTNYYINATYGGTNSYYHIDDKPLLVIHPDASSTWPSNTFPKANRFSLRHSQERVQAQWYGWWPDPCGPVLDTNGEMTLIEPGHNNHSASDVRRNNGAYYINGWHTILAWPPRQARPKIVLLASFNEYIEENAVWTADTTFLDTYRDHADEQWTSAIDQSLHASMYWDLTAANIEWLRGVTADCSSCSGIAAWWPAESSAYELIRGASDTLEGTVTFEQGKLGKAFGLNGSNQDVRVADRIALRLSTGMTLQAWIKPSRIGYWQNIISKWDGCYQVPGQRSYVLGLDPDNHVYVGISRDGTDSTALSTSSSSVVPTTDWSHVLGTYDGSTLRIYVNGVLEASQSYGSSGNIFQGTNALSIGAVIGGCSPGSMISMFAGLIDEPIIHGRALSGAEVLSTYNAGRLEAWWPGETNASDVIGVRADTLEGGAGFATGKIGQAFNFDGTNDDVRVPRRNALDLTVGMTLQAWIKPGRTGYWQNLISKWDGCYQSPTQKSYLLGLDPNNHVYVGVSRDGTDATALSTSSVSVVTNSIWTHVAGTYDGTTLRIYVNGFLESSVSYSTAGNIFQGTDDLSIGAVVGGCSAGSMISMFQGLIDEPAVHNRALADVEIWAIYNAGASGLCPPSP